MARPSIKLRSGDLEARISPYGAELVGLRHAEHGELLWGGDKTWWDRQSPLMFPVVGRSIGDHVTINGKSWPMPLHGFAHSMVFDVLSASETEMHLRLSDSVESHTHYPFPFQLDVTYRLDGSSLTIEAVTSNTGNAPLPAQFGFHPGFVWPLPGSSDRSGHAMILETDDHLDVLRAQDGFMLSQPTRLELQDRRLDLSDDLFKDGAMVMRNPASRSVLYEADGADCAIRVSWSGLSRLLFWTRPGAPFICIEPWAGEPDPAGFTGELSERPGVELIAPGDFLTYGIEIAIADPI